MKLVAATLYALRIPFVESFSHSATERRHSVQHVNGAL